MPKAGVAGDGAENDVVPPDGPLTRFRRTVRAWLGSFRGNPQKQQLATAWVSGLSALASALAAMSGLLYAGWQLNLTRNALLSQNTYNIEKDYADLFGRLNKSEAFRRCFVSETKVGNSPIPLVCADAPASDLFDELLIHYRLIWDLSRAQALPKDYFEIRLSNFCPIASTASSKQRIRLDMHLYDPSFRSYLNKHCKLDLDKKSGM